MPWRCWRPNLFLLGVLFCQLQMELGQRAQRLCSLAGMRGVVSRLANQLRLALLIERRQVFMDFGVVLMLDRVRRVVRRKFLMFLGGAVGLRHFLEILVRELASLCVGERAQGQCRHTDVRTESCHAFASIFSCRLVTASADAPLS